MRPVFSLAASLALLALPAALLACKDTSRAAPAATSSASATPVISAPSGSPVAPGALASATPGASASATPGSATAGASATAASSGGLWPAGSAPAAVASGVPASWPGRSDGCADGMVRVEGEYCPVVMQDCIKHHPEYAGSKGDKNVSERCLSYQQPSRCLSKERVHLSFCMDRFEYPNKVGELPRVLTPWTEAVDRCAAESKRLCTEEEFNFACEGPAILPYVYGFDRDATKCNIDRFYERPDHSRVLPTYDKCPDSPFCAAEIKRLDQRHRIGERLTCVSWSGIYDLNGNVNEWVNLPKEHPPNRSGLKGGWWGPVRSRCRPTVTFHKENDYGYEAGFRCCKDAG